MAGIPCLPIPTRSCSGCRNRVRAGFRLTDPAMQTVARRIRRVNLRAPGAPPPSLRSSTCVVALVLLLLFQFVFMAHHSVVMAAGTEICTSEGTKHLSAEGDSIGDAGHHHDCCSTGKLAAPPATRLGSAQEAAGTVTSTFITTDRLAAQWLAPLSRGPPSFS